MKRFCLGLAFVLPLVLASTSFAQQPFANVQQAPTVSPYLNLSNSRGGNTNYQSLVRPLIEQQNTNQQQQQQIQQLSQQQSNLAATGLVRPARGAASTIRGTGHVAGFMVRGNYYPQSQTSTSDPIMRRLVTMNYTQ